MNSFTVVSDPGIDDLVALVLLYRLNPFTRNILISTFGNANEETTSVNAKEFISFVARSWSFRNGSNLPLCGNLDHPWPDYFHGADGVWGVHPKVNIRKINIVNAENNKLISLGPLTDPLKIIRKEKIQEITLMGGAFEVEGNETKYAETNIAFDTDAAGLFFREIKNIQVRVVPLDVTRHVYWTREKIERIPLNNKTNNWLKKLLLTWYEKYDHKREKNFHLHDPLAVYLNAYPSQALWKISGVNVVISGKMRGRTIFEKHNPNCEIALKLKNANYISDFIFETLFEKD
jgi:inosine-uridine nucleoside N-ribohydrolase